MLNLSIKKGKKKAQHIVEFALMMPFFIILFSWIFQMMAETYSKYKFSYVFSSAITNAVNFQPVYEDMENSKNYSLAKSTKNILTQGLMRTNKSPYTDIDISTIETKRVTFLLGVFNFVNTMIFIGNTGNAYFYYALPVGSAFIKPMVLNVSNENLENYFENYYKIYAEKFCSDMVGESCSEHFPEGE